MRRRMWPALVLLLLVAGCVGSPQSEKAWRSSADLTLGSVIGGLGTAQVVLEAKPGNKLPHPYAVVTLTDMVDTTQKGIDKFLVSQPPDRLHGQAQRLTSELHRAAELLVRVRDGYSSPKPSSATVQELLREVRSELDDLNTLRGKVGG